MIDNVQISIDLKPGQDLAETIEEKLGNAALRWYVSQVQAGRLQVEASLWRGEPLARPSTRTSSGRIEGGSAVLSIIPTGIGCELGGFAGDAAPLTALLAAAADYLITNPNAVNASDFINLGPNTVYADGASIDQFCRQEVDFHLPRANRIGLIVEAGEQSELEHVLNLVNAVRAVHGVDIAAVAVTEGRVGSRCVCNPSGAFVGTVDHPQRLFRAAESLMQQGAQALAVTTNVQDLPALNYAEHFAGAFPNPVGGVEAVISYLLQRRFQVPVAHAPLINFKEMGLKSEVVDARGAGEIVSKSGLACILVGLRRAPGFRPAPGVRTVLSFSNLAAVVAPAGALGGIPVLRACRQGIPVIAVGENSSILRVRAEALGLQGVIEVGNYLEAAGVLLALKEGISLETVRRPLATLRVEETVRAAERRLAIES